MLRLDIGVEALGAEAEMSRSSSLNIRTLSSTEDNNSTESKYSPVIGVEERGSPPLKMTQHYSCHSHTALATHATYLSLR